MVDREVLAIAVAGSQWRYAQHVGDELERASIPGKDHRARAGEPRLFFVDHLLSRCLPYLILDHSIRPGDSHRVRLGIITQSKYDRYAGVGALLIPGAGLYFHHCSHS